MTSFKFIRQLHCEHTPFHIKVSYYNTKGIFERPRIQKPEQAYEIFKSIWDKDALGLQEQFYALFLNKANKMLGWRLISTGTMDGVVVDKKLILAIALHTLSSSIIVAHNHPSTNLMPSRRDEIVTVELMAALKSIGCELTDHLILSPENDFFSMADNGLL